MAKDTSVSQFLSVLIPNIVIFAVFIILFISLRKKQKRVYEPRCVVETVPGDLQPDQSPKGFLKWVPHTWNKSTTYMIQEANADGYFFTRYIFTFACIFLGSCFLLWPVLFAVNASNGNGEKGFNTISYANVDNKWRFLAHVFLSWCFFGGSIFVIYRELTYYTTFRHALQTTPLYDSLLSSRTMLLTELPEKYLKESELRGLFPTALKIWFGRDYNELQDKVKERQKLSKKYEGALNKVLKKAVKIRQKALKKGVEPPTPENELNKYLKDGKKRPTHKLKFLIGKKVDTLNYGVERIGELNTEIKKAQSSLEDFESVPAAVVEFPSQLELQKAYQAVPYHPDLKKTNRVTGAAPDDIIWSNLSLGGPKRHAKRIIANTILTLMIIFWCIPVAVVGFISNINLLTEKVHFLRFINNMPDKIMGIITGLLPVVLLAVLMSLVPPFIKYMGKFGGALTVQEIEGYCQTWFYAFQIVNSFIVVTITSAAASTISDIITDPGKALKLLASNLPKASNFYISYYLLYGLSVSSGLLLQLVALILAQFLGKILDSTPRAKWNRWNNLGQPGWSTIYPGFSFMIVIAFAYAIIAPLILGFAFAAMTLIYVAYRYNLIYVLQPNSTDAKGRNFARSMLQLFPAIYLSEVVLVAMFVFGKNWVSTALEAVIIPVTIVAHYYLKRKFLPLWDTVPLSAIKYASGDNTFQYPMHDQGLSEIKSEGENYWNGGSELGLNSSHQHDRVLAKNEFKSGVSDEAIILGDQTSESSDKEKVGTDVSRKDSEKEIGVPTRIPNASQAAGGIKSLVTRFFHPKLVSFDDLRDKMPDCYFNYIEYNEDYTNHAYDDPCINDEEPHIWTAKDEMGLSQIEKNRALEQGVSVWDENAGFDEKGNIVYLGPPPKYEEVLKV